MSEVALITGASRGLGAELARFLARNGYDLILTARGGDDLERIAIALGDQGVDVRAEVGDVAEASHRRRLARVVDGFGRLDILVNNASGLGVTPRPALVQHPLDDLHRLFLVNTVAPVGLVQDTLPYLRAARGLIVNITSDAAVGAYPGWGGYGATKAALELMTRTLGAELLEDGVSAVAVDPGDLRTAMHQAAFPGDDISDRPLPEVTLPFWAWLMGREPLEVTGGRFQAQGSTWEVNE